MIAQFRVLKEVKELRQNKALRALEAARSTLRDAEERAEALSREVEESAATLPARERALFEPILGQEIGTAEVDEVKERVHALIEAHQWLSDRRDRARDHVRRCQEQLKQARQELRKCEAEHEKIDTLLSDMRQIAEGAAMAREETEIEDLFSRPRLIGGLH
ncbi:YscO family type III secretion system apparatus protein [Phaeobacter sp. HF9A]|uniref:type III secretion system stalk subunit SctO n=1 Tax=Phaeobacter sp. HF9A TaxID=2721561 RepID=UPI001431DE23|nr:YscO family type III secretion system apparatus protein [Phaeobacter sp. HF9A]NIZ12006.1 YscO family type III secretion system apparatus protein [Phaeobacter sp. HF9A]